MNHSNALATGLLALLAMPILQPGHSPAQIGNERQLFVDRLLIDRMDGVRLKMHSPVRREAALRMEHPWEEKGVSYMATFKDGDRFRAWYRADAATHRTAYAESKDGINWVKPMIGPIPFGDHKKTNLVWEGEDRAGNLSVLKDPNPDVPPGERYKGIVRGRSRILALVSEDGIHWRPFREKPLIDSYPVDSHNILIWDPRQEQYAIYLRGIRKVPGEPRDATSWKTLGVRWVRRSLSRDFRSWSEPRLIDSGSSPIEQFYTNDTVVYERAPGYFLMFPSRFVVERVPVPDWPAGSGVNDIVLLSSRDGLNWDRTFREAFLRPGPDPNTWHERALYMEHGVLQTGPRELSMYAMHNWRTDDTHIRRLSLRLDGFASVHGDYDGGTLITRPLVFEGSELEINFATSAVGSLRFELRDGSNNPLPGFGLQDCDEIYGDEIDRVVKWKGSPDVSSLAGRPVRLHIQLRDADLYSFRFR